MEIARNLYMGVIEGFQQLQGVFFFHAREVYIPKEWEPNHKVVMKIGNHVFYNRKES
jgi:spore germination cell wall hydrolase CwlJ-like protein